MRSDARRCAARARSVCGSGSRVELDGDPHEAQHPQRVLGERLGRRPCADAAPRGPQAPRAGRSAGRRPRHSGSAIALTVKSRSARSSSERVPAQALDVDLPGAVAGDHAPGAVLLREGEARPRARARAGERARGVGGIAVDDDVEVRGGTPQQAVSRAAATSHRGALRRRAARAACNGRAAARIGPPCIGHAAIAVRRTRRRGASLISALAVVVVPRCTRLGEATGDLVVDRVQPPGELLGGDPLGALSCRSGPPARRSSCRAEGSAPRSTATLSMLTVPTSGRRRPADQHVGVVREPAAPAIAVADRQHRRDACLARR